MFDLFRQWLGFAPVSLAPQKALQKLNTVAPLRSAPKEAPPTETGGAHSFVCREEILNRSERISGYEFAPERRLPSRMLKKSVRIRQVYDESMLHNFASLGVSSLLGDRFALIRLSLDSLNHPFLERLAHSNAVIMMMPGTATEADVAGVRASLQRLEALGIKHGWTLNQTQPEITGFLHEADFVEVDATDLDGIQLKTLYRGLRAIPGKPKLIASELQTSDDFNLCYHCGFDYFMGPFISSRENWHPAKSEINRLQVFEVLNMIRAEAGFDAIADRLRLEPVLTFKLLRYINSPGIGLLKKVDDISQALLILGRDRFYRWLSLLLFDFNQPGYRERVLNEQVLARARFMEMLAGQGRVPAAGDQLFMTGLFSLLDVMMVQPLDEVLKQVTLPEAVAAALKGEPGAMRNTLVLGMTVESGTPDEMATAAARCGLDAGTVTSTMVEALAWTQQMSAAGE